MNQRQAIQREIEDGLSRMRRDMGLESHVAGYLTIVLTLTVFAFTLVAAVVVRMQP